MSDPEWHTVAALMGDPSRAAMLLQLMGGCQRPASELAQVAHVSPATASEHLAKLVAGGLVHVRRLMGVIDTMRWRALTSRRLWRG